MSYINKIENAILELSPGAYQKFMDAYIMKKYSFENIHTLGVQEGVDKTTKGTPDSFVRCNNGKYILIMHGTVRNSAYSKLRSDILSCFDKKLLNIEDEKIEKIICTFTATNISVEQLESLSNLVAGVTIELIGLSTVAHDLEVKYRYLAKNYLDISIDTGQIMDTQEFVEQYDLFKMNAPLNIDFMFRQNEFNLLKEMILAEEMILVSGISGIGKTKLVLEVCKAMAKECGFKVLCVKNNDQPLYEDIICTINDSGTYLLFLDDANNTTNLSSIIDYIVSKKRQEEIKVKIIATVRDYAKESVYKETIKRIEVKEYVLEPMSAEDIRNILINKYKINNEHYLKQILKISNGNIRLAVLAAITAKEKGFVAINNAIDIFSNFYGPIFKDNQITKKELIILFALSLYGPARLEQHEGIKDILLLGDITKKEYIDTCERLNEYELIDIFHDSAVRVSDQSFSNYILEYVLIEKKYISISDILNKSFPKFSNKIIYAINTISRLFYCESTIEYIKKEINKSWKICKPCDEIKYIKAFMMLNEEKSLLYVKRIIDCQLEELDELNSLDFVSELSNIHRISDEIQILTSFKDTKYYKTSVDLLIEYFTKRPIMGKEIVLGIKQNMGINNYSDKKDYAQERYLICQLYQKYKEKNNLNYAILLICIIKEYLIYEFSKIEDGNTPKSCLYTTYYLNYTDNLVGFRKELLTYLKEFYEIERLKVLIKPIISNLSPKSNEKGLDIFREDVQILHQLFDNEDVPNFGLSILLGTLSKRMHWLGLDATKLEEYIYRNKQYSVYSVLTREHTKGERWEDEEKNRNNAIDKLIKNYGYEDFCFLFKSCKDSVAYNKENDWVLMESINYIFDSIQINENKFINAINAYFANGSPYLHRTNEKVSRLLKLKGSIETKKMIENINDKSNRIWKKAFFEEIDERAITLDIIKDLLLFIKEQVNVNNARIPEVYCINKYKNKEIDVLKEIKKILLEGANKFDNISKFLGMVFNEEKALQVYEIFKLHIKELKELYLEATGSEHFDYGGFLLKKLIIDDFDFWNAITIKWSKNHEFKLGKNFFDSIWQMKDYNLYIDIAYKNASNPYLGYYKNEIIANIFEIEDDENSITMSNKELWISEFIEKNAMNEENIKDIFSIINEVLPNRRIFFLKCLFKFNFNFSLFKKIDILPLSRSWSNSEVPLIDEEILFLNKLLNEFEGIEFYEHKEYVNELINLKKEYKHQVLEREYLEKYDIF